MKCPNCGIDIDGNARFCPSCGVVLIAAERKPAAGLPKRPIIAILVVIGVLILAALAFTLLRPHGPAVSQSPITAPPSSSVVQSEVRPLTPRQSVIQTEIPPAPKIIPPVEEKAPIEVIQYLEFVKGIEQQRQEMRVDFGPALDMMKSAYGEQLGLDDESEEPQQKVAKGYSDYTQQWNQLVQKFDTVQAPEPCRQFAGAYRQALGTYVSMMTKIQVALIQNDINTLQSMRSKAQPDIDKMLRESDSQLTQVTNRYKLEKPFTITPDREVDTIFGW
ncbi:MAG: zinc-ribbon domain-containing protein [Armatimonadota bacterium]|nr:zinc-ribbon domain-containing protein [Armatimonadota bacterium]